MAGQAQASGCLGRELEGKEEKWTEAIRAMDGRTAGVGQSRGWRGWRNSVSCLVRTEYAMRGKTREGDGRGATDSPAVLGGGTEMPQEVPRGTVLGGGSLEDEKGIPRAGRCVLWRLAWRRGLYLCRGGVCLCLYWV